MNYKKHFILNINNFLEEIKGRKLEVILLTALTLIFIATIIYDINLRNAWEIINHPTFVGEVIGKDPVTRRHSAGMRMLHTEYRLHIVGSYRENGEIIQIDRIFVVPRFVYEEYSIGDVIGGDF